MNCRECPYGKEDFERRMYWYQKTVNERGIPNEIYGSETYEDAVDDAEQFLWCDKVGGKVYCFGHCTDFYEDTDEIHINRSKRKRRNKRERDEKYKDHLKYLSETVGRKHLSPVSNTNVIFIRGEGWVKTSKPYYKRLYRGKRSKYLKRQSNKAIRRYKGELHNGNICHRIYDFWWQYD